MQTSAEAAVRLSGMSLDTPLMAPASGAAAVDGQAPGFSPGLGVGGIAFLAGRTAEFSSLWVLRNPTTDQPTIEFPPRPGPMRETSTIGFL